MPVAHVIAGNQSSAPADSASAFAALQRFMAARSRASPVDDFEHFEVELHAMVSQVEREVLAEELAKLDVDVPAIEIEGDAARRTVRCEQDYVTAAGTVGLTRSLYRVDRNTKVECPLELRAGIVAGRDFVGEARVKYGVRLDW